MSFADESTGRASAASASVATPPADRAGRFGLRLAVWYATLFIASSAVIVLITYLLTSSSLAQRDHQIIDANSGYTYYTILNINYLPDCFFYI